MLAGSPQWWELTLAAANSQQMSESRFAVQVIKHSSQTDRAESAKSSSYDTNVCETIEARQSPLKLTLMFSFSTTAVFFFLWIKINCTSGVERRMWRSSHSQNRDFTFGNLSFRYFSLAETNNTHWWTSVWSVNVRQNRQTIFFL